MRSISRTAVVLAAGKSTRIAPVAAGLPKPLIEIGGETILGHNLRWLARQRIEEVWITLHYRPDTIRERVGDGSAAGVKVNYAYEREILGTAGGVRAITAKWRDAFFVVYGDNLIQADLELMERTHRTGAATATIALFDRERHPHTGIGGGTVTLDGSGRIATFNEGAMAAASSLVNAGLYLLEPEVVSRIPVNSFCDFGRDLFPQLLASQVPIAGHMIDGYCLGIDTPDAYREAIRLVADGIVRL